MSMATAWMLPLLPLPVLPSGSRPGNCRAASFVRVSNRSITRPLGTSWDLVVEQPVVRAETLVAEVQLAAKKQNSDAVIGRIVEPSGGCFQGLDLTLLNPSLTALEPERSGDSRRQTRYN